MTTDRMFSALSEYAVPLLRLLNSLPGGQGYAAEVVHLFERQYGDRIPDQHRRIRGTTKTPIWDNNVRWCRNTLKMHGFVDSPRIGVWRITEAGRHWLAENPTADRLPPLSQPRRQSQRSRTGRSTHPPASRLAGLTLDRLEETRRVMPPDQFRAVWGDLYDSLVAEERTGAITRIARADLEQRVFKRLGEIHAFLLGGQSTTPTAEALFEWVRFCHALGLRREVTALVALIPDGSLEPAVVAKLKVVAAAWRQERGMP